MEKGLFVYNFIIYFEELKEFHIFFSVHYIHIFFLSGIEIFVCRWCQSITMQLVFNIHFVPHEKVESLTNIVFVFMKKKNLQ